MKEISTLGLMLVMSVAAAHATEPPGTATYSSGQPQVLSTEPLGPRHSGMDDFRSSPHEGYPNTSHGYPHYDLPGQHYGIWFRPHPFGMSKNERCRTPAPWRPRGFGNLFARPSTPYRMDYNRYQVSGATMYGPSYYVRQPDPRCRCHEKNCPGCNCCKGLFARSPENCEQ